MPVVIDSAVVIRIFLGRLFVNSYPAALLLVGIAYHFNQVIKLAFGGTDLPYILRRSDIPRTNTGIGAYRPDIAAHLLIFLFRLAGLVLLFQNSLDIGGKRGILDSVLLGLVFRFGYIINLWTKTRQSPAELGKHSTQRRKQTF